ncbi:MAG TPA: TRAM domain-containing protein [Acidimicrobiales bacterium]|nr:TRAM domain-containing protein [Acidimicrobiales bacterium]
MADRTDDSLLELEMGPVAAGGGCVSRAPDGRVVFVRHSLPGELVRARVTAMTSSFLRADAVEILRPSADRVDPPCPHAGPGRCGGCDFQHATLGAQRAMKAFRIAEQLRRVAGVTRTVEVEAVPGDEEGLAWRSRLRLAVDRDGHVGFRRHRSHAIEPIDACPVATPAVDATGALAARWPGAAAVDVATGIGVDDAVVRVAVRGRTRVALPDVVAGVVVGGTVRRPPAAVHAVVAGRKYRVSPGVFWQVHVGAAAALLEAVLALAAPVAGETAVDLYAGAGLFAVPLAEAVGAAGSVLAVERDRHACADARHNGAGMGALHVLEDSVTPELVTGGIGRPGLVVLDPAREGAGIAVMAALAAHAPTLERVLYVSCDPASFARDARVLLDAGWELAALRAFDIFPMTEHVELVALLRPPA